MNIRGPDASAFERDNLICPVNRLHIPVKRLSNPVKRKRENEAQQTDILPEVYSYGRMQLPMVDINIRLGDCILPSQAPLVQNEIISSEEMQVGHRIVPIPTDYQWLADFLCQQFFLPSFYYFIEAGTGAGKTTFVEKVLFYRFSNILYVTNRVSNKTQFWFRNRYWNGVTVISYQSLEKSAIMNSKYLDSFDCVVFDEFSYILSDALITGTTEISVRKMLESTKATKFFISATIRDAKDFFLSKLIQKYDNSILSKCVQYRMKQKSFPVRTVSETDWNALLPDIEASDYQWIIFVKEKKTGKKLCEKLGKCATYLDSDIIKRKGKGRNTFEQIVRTERFDEKVLITTSLLDMGVNVRMPTLKGLVFDCTSKDQLKQEFGRKRFIDENDWVDVFLIHRRPGKLEVERRRRIKELKTANAYKFEFEHFGGPSHMVNEEGKAADFYRKIIVYDYTSKVFRINEACIRQLQIYLRDLNELIYSEDSFEKKLTWLFGDDANHIPVASRMGAINYRRAEQMLLLLEPLKGQEIQKLGTVSTEFRQAFTTLYHSIYGLDTEENHRTGELLSFDKINVALKKTGLGLYFEQYSVKKKAHVRLIETMNNYEQEILEEEDDEIEEEE